MSFSAGDASIGVAGVCEIAGAGSRIPAAAAAIGNMRGIRASSDDKLHRSILERKPDRPETKW
jgi:hypothetical protein